MTQHEPRLSDLEARWKAQGYIDPVRDVQPVKQSDLGIGAWHVSNPFGDPDEEEPFDVY
jgi:hypothetical protein